MLNATVPAVILAPMEGVTDAPMRLLHGATGAFTYAVSEFLRVSQAVPPKAVFFKHIPELKQGARTATGLPVQVQLLGGDAGRLAESAMRAVECGATAIDMNFGCPAKTVNRHDGGATLLQYPHRIRDIIKAIRTAIPAHVPISAKLRLGWDDINAIHENAAMAEQGGATWITIHARTRAQGYQPPVFWPLIGRVREALAIPVVANGDIWTQEDFHRCRAETGCIHFMLGRGALANPQLAHFVATELGLATPREETPVDWRAQMINLMECSNVINETRPRQTLLRMKQWLRLAAVHGTFRQFNEAKRATTVEELLKAVL
ncbi:tRNA dihydrouridine(16) synthase DusC [soil metagenome]